MIDQATGMRAGERYCVENIERAHQFPGLFQDGKYYLGPELLTAVGWLEGTQFIYDSLDAQGEPVFPDRVAGIIEGMKLVLVDGTTLALSRLEERATFASAEVEVSHGPEQARPLCPLSSGNPFQPPSDRRSVTDGWNIEKHHTPLCIGAAVLGILAGFLITRSQHRRR